jgi:threonine aldolase
LNSDINEKDFVENLANKNIHVISMGGGKLRMVTHLDYTDVMHEKLLKFIKNLAF